MESKIKAKWEDVDKDFEDVDEHYTSGSASFNQSPRTSFGDIYSALQFL